MKNTKISAINLQAPVTYTGYGVAGFNILVGLMEEGVETSLFPIGQPIAINPSKLSLVEKAYNNRIKYNHKAPSLKIWHAWDLQSRIGSGPNYVFPFFELDTLSDIEQHNFQCSDHVFVASHWAKEILLKYNISTPISVVPLGVDTSIFDHNILAGNKPDKYIFSVIGKWEIRKCHDILLDIFAKAFPNNENYELWVNASSDNGYINNEEKTQWENMYSSSPIKDKVKLFPPLKTHADMAKFLSYVDCGVYISRAEGWNLELLETMAMNKPVIASNYSAHTEFCNSDNSYLVDIDDIEPAHDGKYFRGQGNWAKIGQKQIDQTVDYLRFVYNSQIKTNPEGLKTAQNLSWSNSARTLINSV